MEGCVFFFVNLKKKNKKKKKKKKKKIERKKKKQKKKLYTPKPPSKVNFVCFVTRLYTCTPYPSS